MSLNFLIAVLEWLQDQFIKANDKHTNNVNDLAGRIQVLAAQRDEELKQAKLAISLANKIDKLLTE